MYSLLALVHWKPRERSIAQALTALTALCGGNQIRHRVVDIGCGPGWLARTATAAQCTYLGVDPACTRPRDVDGGRIESLDAYTVQPHLEPNDIVVLNGVAHHLDDETLKGLLEAACACSALIICDHRAQASNHHLNRLLHRLDKGRCIRPYAFFDTLVGYRTHMLETFDIRPLGFPAWAYFTGVYRPDTAADDAP